MANSNIHSDLQKERSERIYNVFNQLNIDTMHLIDEFYDENVEFIDPIGKVNGSANMKAYYENMYKNVKDIRFEFTKEFINGDEHMVIWRMYLKAERLNKGQEVSLDGNSHIVFGGDDNKVIYHRDYFDMGEFIYQHIPVLGFLVRKLNSRFELKEQ